MINEKDERAISQNLADAGCGEDLIKEIISALKCESCSGMKHLEKYRGVLLEALHEDQKKIDCLDYLIWKLKKQL